MPLPSCRFQGYVVDSSKDWCSLYARSEPNFYRQIQAQQTLLVKMGYLRRGKLVVPPIGALAAAGEEGEAMPEEWMAEVIPRSVWEAMGLDVAPFCVQAEAPMHLVHFYFSQLTLNAVFVVERGRFVGMINKQDMHHADVV